MPAAKLSGLTPLQQQQAIGRASLIETVREKLGSDIATALSTQDQLTTSLETNTNQDGAIAARTAKASAKIARLDHEIADLDSSIVALQGRIDRERSMLSRLARQMYLQPDSVLLQVAESTTLGEVLTSYTDLYSAASRAEALKSDLQASSNRLHADRARLDEARAQQRVLRRVLTANLTKLAKLQVQQQQEAGQLAGQIESFKWELSGIDRQSPDLAQEITTVLEQEQDGIVAEAMQSVWDQVETLSLTAAAIDLKLPAASPSHSKKTRFIWPEPHAIVTQPFGPTAFGFEPPYMSFPHFHTGIDLAEPLGSPVLAADDGVVVLAGDSVVGGQQVGYGNYVVVVHPDHLTTLYGHLAMPLVKVGDAIKQGEPIGLEGSTGNSTGPHCHFELRIDGQFVDPTPFLPPGPSPSNS